MSSPKQIKISEILEHLTRGYTRLKVDKNYDSKIGSIQEKYELNRSQIAELFKHPKLKGRKTISPKLSSFEIVDDTEVSEEADNSTSQEDDNTEEVSTPDTQTSTDIDDAADEEQPELDSAGAEVVKVEEETAESSGKDGDEWLPN